MTLSIQTNADLAGLVARLCAEARRTRRMLVDGDDLPNGVGHAMNAYVAAGEDVLVAIRKARLEVEADA